MLTYSKASMITAMRMSWSKRGQELGLARDRFTVDGVEFEGVIGSDTGKRLLGEYVSSDGNYVILVSSGSRIGIESSKVVLQQARWEMGSESRSP
jgi:hypothetical protein